MTYWRKLQPWLRLSIPGAIYRWLELNSSMTAFLRQYTKRAVHVTVLHDSVDIVSHRVVRVREVILYCGDIPAIYAKTYIPKLTTCVYRRLCLLGNQPLGDYLFKHRQLKRSTINIVRLAQEHHLVKQIAKRLNFTPSKLWARQSIFCLQQQPIEVMEILLPTFEELLHGH